MNTIRALRVTNIFFILCGYQIHCYNLKTKDFRISVFSVLFFLAYLTWYIAGLAKHLLEKSLLFTLFEGVSPFLYNCMHIHLVIGVKIILLILFDSKSIAKVSTHLSQVFANHLPARFTITEFMVYFILFSNFIILIVLAIYDISMVQPKHFNLSNAMALSAVFSPHFGIACVLKYLGVVMWIITQDLNSLSVDLQLILTQHNSKNDMSIITIQEPISMTTQETSMNRQFDPCPLDRSIDLTRIVDRLKTIKLISIEFNRVVQKQLFTLVIMSALVFIESSYAFMYFGLVWKEVLFDNYRNAFFATFGCFYLLVFLDFTILFSASHILSNKKKKILNYIDNQLRSLEWNHDVLHVLGDIKTTLKSLTKFKIFFTFSIDWQIFILGGGQVLLSVGLFTLFQYTKQQFMLSAF